MIDVTELFLNGEWEVINEIISEIKQNREEYDANSEADI